MSIPLNAPLESEEYTKQLKYLFNLKLVFTVRNKETII